MSTDQARPSPTNRRLLRRRPLKHGVEVTVRKGTLGLGPNLARGGIDLSEDGMRFLSIAALQRGDEVEINLIGVGRSKPMKLFADVRWCQPMEDEAALFQAGVKFHRRLTYFELSQYV